MCVGVCVCVYMCVCMCVYVCRCVGRGVRVRVFILLTSALCGFENKYILYFKNSLN